MPSSLCWVPYQVKQSLDKAHNMALEILKLNRGLLETTTQTLLEAEVLEGEALKAILAQAVAPDKMSAGSSTANRLMCLPATANC